MGSRSFFQDVADALAGFLPPELRDFSSQVTSRMLKVWFEAWREHYEVQLVSSHALPKTMTTKGRVLEVGFHAEHPDPEHSRATVEALVECRRTWARRLPEAEAGAFFGSDRWARLSEVWTGSDVTDPEAAVEAAERLAAYITAIEPVRRSLVPVARR